MNYVTSPPAITWPGSGSERAKLLSLQMSHQTRLSNLSESTMHSKHKCHILSTRGTGSKSMRVEHNAPLTLCPTLHSGESELFHFAQKLPFWIFVSYNHTHPWKANRFLYSGIIIIENNFQLPIHALIIFDVLTSFIFFQCACRANRHPTAFDTLSVYIYWC